jgi:DNA repair photolyase
MIAPVIPFINDHELEALVDACAAAGAQALRYILLRLPLEVKPLFEEWLENHYPLKAQRVMAAVRDTRGGKAYDPRWHQRMVGQGELAGLIGKRFDRALKRHGLDDASLPPLRTDLFLPPRSSSSGQLDLFG